MQNHTDIEWFHSIDLGNGITTKGSKSEELLKSEFHRLELTAETLRGKRVLDIGCNDGYMSLMCASLGADVTSIDGVCTDGLKFIRRHLKPKIRFYAIDMMSPSFYELGRFDVILYLGVLYHTIYPFEQILRLASASEPNARIFLESAYRDIPDHENLPTIVFNYDGSVAKDVTSPCFPSNTWIEQTLKKVGFSQIRTLQKIGGAYPGRGRVTVTANYKGGAGVSPLLYASGQQ